MTEPFSVRELTGRIRSALRRTTKPQRQPAMACRGKHLQADFDAVSVSVSVEGQERFG